MTKARRPRDAAHLVVIDRLDDEVATIVVEARTYTLPRRFLPPGTKEGDALRVSFERDDEATLKMRREVGSRLDRLREGDGGGDESL